jgi:hypothetical protein
MAEKINPDPRASITPNTDLMSVIKLNHGLILPKFTGLGSAADLLRIRNRERVQSSAPDLRMCVRIQRKNKHPHSTKKHK